MPTRDADPSEDARAWVMSQVRERTDSGELWTGRRPLKQDSSGDRAPHSKDEVLDAISELLADGELFEWHGLLTLREPERLRAVIQSEAESDVTRRILINQCQDALKELNGDTDE